MDNLNVLPQGWKWIKLGDIIDVRDGTHDSPTLINDGIPLVTSKNLKSNGIDFENVSFISIEDHEKIKRRSEVNKGDILFAMIGTIGNPVIVDTDKEFSIKNVALFKCNKNISQYFLYFILQSEFIKKQLDSTQQGGIQKFVSLGSLRNLQVPIPSLPEQQRLAKLLTEKLAIVEQAKKAAEAQLEAINQLPAALLKQAFKGEL